MQEILNKIKGHIFENAILGGTILVTIALVVFLLAPVDYFDPSKLIMTSGFGFIAIVAGLIWHDFS